MIWFAVAGVIVAVAAGLLIWVLLEARGIRREALRTLAAAEGVRDNTKALWALPDVSYLLKQTLDTVVSLAGRAETIADAMSPGKTVPRKEDAK